MTEFKYQEMFPLGYDTTEYRRLTYDHVSEALFEGRNMVKIDSRRADSADGAGIWGRLPALRRSDLKLLVKLLMIRKARTMTGTWLWRC